MRINTKKTSLKIKIELKLRWICVYRGIEADLVGRGVEVAEKKDRDAAPSKLKKEIGGYLAEMGTYKSRTTIKRTTKDI